MSMRETKALHQRIADSIRRIFRKPEPDPDDPYALVGAPKKPRTPLRTLAAAVKPEPDPLNRP
ncbi:MAG TPA: hypothetical protein VNX18_07060 [Bryobacteraceae bacterium]|nr:hypothetical protein [Bryobacteraceae bacterium]